MKSNKDRIDELSPRPILQTGLFCRTDEQAKGMVDRVTKFNLNNLGTPIQLDVIPFEKGDRHCADPHYKIRLHFPSKRIQLRFWGL